MAGRYQISVNGSPGAATNIFLELAAVSGHPFELVEFEVSQEAATTTAAFAVQLGVSTATATGWTTSAPTLVDLDNLGLTANTTAKFWTSGTSTDGTSTVVRKRVGLNVLGLPYLWIPPSEGRIYVGSGHFLAAKFVAAPPAATAFTMSLIILER